MFVFIESFTGTKILPENNKLKFEKCVSRKKLIMPIKYKNNR